jgi:chaperone modulatory protein CbpM
MKRHLVETALAAGLDPDRVERFILFTWVRPADPDQPHLDDCDLARCRLIEELQSDFGVNDAAVPVILDLLDQLHELRRGVNKIN